MLTYPAVQYTCDGHGMIRYRVENIEQLNHFCCGRAEGGCG